MIILIKIKLKVFQIRKELVYTTSVRNRLSLKKKKKAKSSHAFAKNQTINCTIMSFKITG